MKVRQPEAPTVIEHAIEWIERLKVTEGDSEAFFDWLTDSPRHVEVFMQAITLENQLASIAPEQWTALETTTDATAAVQGEPTNVVALGTQVIPATRLTVKRGWRLSALAASATLLAVGGWYLFQWLAGWQDFTTTVGEQRAIQLRDGSIVNLNTDSHLKVRLSAQARDIRLLQGEALFKVQHDGGRPFRVYTHDAVIQAVGTQFDVYQRNHNTTVSVLEGRVRVSAERMDETAGAAVPAASMAAAGSPAVSAGEQADIERDGQIKRRTSVNAVHVTAWQQRRLMFDEETLASIAFEFNRYNRRHLRIEGVDAGTRRFSGIFDADDPESLAQLLSRDNGLIVERTDDEIVIQARAAIDTPGGASSQTVR